MKPMNVMNILKEGENEEKICCLCKKKFKGWGNDAWPLADGYCCDECNASKVLPARIAQMYGIKKESSKPNLVYSNDKRVDIDSKGNATVWKDGKIEKSLKVPKNVKGKDYKKYFDKELKEDDNGISFEQRLKDIFDTVSPEEEYSGYIINNTPIAINTGYTDNDGEYHEGEGVVFYTVGNYLIPTVNGGSLDIQAPNFIKDKSGIHYGDTLSFENDLSDEEIKNTFEKLVSSYKQINPNNRDEKGYSKIIESSHTQSGTEQWMEKGEVVLRGDEMKEFLRLSDEEGFKDLISLVNDENDYYKLAEKPRGFFTLDKVYDENCGKEKLKEGRYTTDEEDNYPGLDKTVKIYDIASFVDKEVNEPGAKEQYQPHTMNKAAIIVKGDGSGCIVDKEAIGSKFDSTDEKVEISLSPKDGDDGKGHKTFAIFPTAVVKIPVKEIIQGAPSEEMKVRDFFKWDYNDRCIQNFNGIKKYIDGSK